MSDFTIVLIALAVAVSMFAAIWFVLGKILRKRDER